MQIWCQFRIRVKIIASEIALSNDTIWDEFSEKRSLQSIKKNQTTYFNSIFFALGTFL